MIKACGVKEIQFTIVAHNLGDQDSEIKAQVCGSDNDTLVVWL